ncbi:MAG: hypothetical protein HXS41_04495 [Theionarchaea archaeon]|nr:hypothetical protein [Theionarchaea archaeon]MBU6999540.1 hypothetical protein [Theionarchaea archaeon]MBU7020296.1 hypothetical protein [Theionarchaea archaeon]MBU7035159.1 hypothetical protein [Theionarchaea archaeon]MBU7041391.1 hypothetical protein [Theionarchaea archaeon]
MEESFELADRWERIAKRYEEDNFLLEKQLVETKIERDQWKKQYESEKKKSWGWALALLSVLLILSTAGLAYFATEYDRLTKENRSLQSQLDAEQQARISLETDLYAKIDQLEAEVATLESENAVYESQVTQLQQEVDDKKKLVEELQKIIKNLREEEPS